MGDLKIIERSDGRKHKNAELFKTVTVFTSGNRDDVIILFTFIQSERKKNFTSELFHSELFNSELKVIM